MYRLRDPYSMPPSLNETMFSPRSSHLRIGIRAPLFVAQIQSNPDQNSDDDRKEEPGIVHPDHGSGSTAEIASQKDCAENRGPRDQINEQADQ